MADVIDTRATLLESDPVCFRRTPDGDLMFPLELATGLEAVEIGIRTRLLMFRGEWFLDLDAGMPWLETPDGVVGPRDAILGQKFDRVKTRSAIVGEIMSTPGVYDLVDLVIEFDEATRRLSISWTVTTVFGDTSSDTLARTI